MNITQQQRQDLTLAVVAGEHQIDADCIRLHRDPTQEGSALSQLVDRVVAVIEQSTAQPQAVVPADQRPVNCGTGYCSCIECVVEPTAQAERAPVVQAVQPEYCTACDMTSNDKQRCEDCPRRASSGATTQAVRMLTADVIRGLLREAEHHLRLHNQEYHHRTPEALLANLAEVNAGRTIPLSGEIGGV